MSYSYEDEPLTSFRIRAMLRGLENLSITLQSASLGLSSRRRPTHCQESTSLTPKGFREPMTYTCKRTGHRMYILSCMVCGLCGSFYISLVPLTLPCSHTFHVSSLTSGLSCYYTWLALHMVTCSCTCHTCIHLCLSTIVHHCCVMVSDHACSLHLMYY